MASVWITTRPTKSGGVRHRVGFRVGGRDTKPRYGGSFKRKADAKTRAAWISGELAALRVPVIGLVEAEQPPVPTLRDAAERWRESRIDVDEQTANMHRSALVRTYKVAPELRDRRIDAITVDDATELVAALAAHPYKHETIRKTKTVLVQVLDHYKIEPNPIRDPRVKLPKERKAHIPSPLAEHVERVSERSRASTCCRSS